MAFKQLIPYCLLCTFPAWAGTPLVPVQTKSTPEHVNRSFGQLQDAVIEPKFNRLLVVDRSHHQIQIVNQNSLVKLQTFGEKTFRFPQDLTLTTEGKLFVADGKKGLISEWDVSNHFPALKKQFSIPQDVHAIAALDPSTLVTVDKFRSRLSLVKGTHIIWSMGSLGSARNQLRQPSDVAVMGQKIYVTDTGNKRIVVFDQRLNPITSITAAPKYPFLKPTSIAIDEKGFIYIADESRHTVYIFDKRHTFIKSINHLPKSKPKNLYRPTGLAAAGGKLWIITQNGINVFQLTYWHKE